MGLKLPSITFNDWLQLYSNERTTSVNGTGLLPSTWVFTYQTHSTSTPFCFIGISPTLYEFYTVKLADIILFFALII
jgi:hypothetical protein